MDYQREIRGPRESDENVSCIKFLSDQTSYPIRVHKIALAQLIGSKMSTYREHSEGEGEQQSRNQNKNPSIRHRE
jgi:hypothetical protein